MGVAHRPDIENFEDTPFEQNKQERMIDDPYYAVYGDKWPVCDGHLLFVPKENSTKYKLKITNEFLELFKSRNIPDYELFDFVIRKYNYEG